MVNKAILLGNVGGDPKVTQLPSGTDVAEFSLATSRKWKSGDGERQDETTWHNVKAFGKLADVIGRYVHKGDRVYVEGRISVRQWEKDGVKHTRTEIVCEELTMLGRKGVMAEQAPAPEPVAASPSSDDDLSEIPFAWIAAIPAASWLLSAVLA